MIAVVLAVVAFLAMAFVVGRASARRRRQAKEDLEREKAALGTWDIMDLVRQEVADTGIDHIAGGDGIDVTVRLRVWHRDESTRLLVEGNPDRLRFVLADGVDPAEADVDDVRLVAAAEEGATPDEAQAP